MPTAQHFTLFTTAGALTLELYPSYSPVAVQRLIAEFTALCQGPAAATASTAPLSVTYIDGTAMCLSSALSGTTPVRQWPEAPVETIGLADLPDASMTAANVPQRALYFSGPGIVALSGAGSSLNARMLITLSAGAPSSKALGALGPDEASTTIVGRVMSGMAAVQKIAAAQCDDEGRPLTVIAVTTATAASTASDLAPRPIGARHAGVDASITGASSASAAAASVVTGGVPQKKARTRGTSSVLAALQDY